MSWEAWGTPEYLDYPECDTCEGTGKVINDFDKEVPCPDCAGVGFLEPQGRLEDDVI